MDINTILNFTNAELPLDISKMNEVAKVLFDYEDFTIFSRLHTDVKINNCKIYRAEWKQENSQLKQIIQPNIKS